MQAGFPTILGAAGCSASRGSNEAGDADDELVVISCSLPDGFELATSRSI